ncbi:DUF2511 domain-containing protein [Halarcobacter anaerophilus]|uniref:DUF2511 domain-containing protein n=1 Tax=Halarcobacter anaerophilus TaxID=877500 RepID=UPI0006986D89|nr:DUF2511 domain-containing protein [Halarcobacter anaerophilus]
MKTIKLIAAIAVAVMLAGCSNYSDKKVTQDEFGEKWAFTVEEATLGCYKDGDTKAPVVVIDGKSYGLTGYADAKYGQNNLNALDKFWKKDTRAGREGMKIDLSAVTREANKLCE